MKKLKRLIIILASILLTIMPLTACTTKPAEAKSLTLSSFYLGRKMPNRHAGVYVKTRNPHVRRAVRTAIRFWKPYYRFHLSSKRRASVIIQSGSDRPHWLAYEVSRYPAYIRIDTRQCRHYRCTYSSVLEHEMGHALGLKHDNNEKRSIMFPYNSSNVHIRQYVTRKVAWEIRCLYC